MFFSLNKKFIYTITIFFLFTASLFVYTFYQIYGAKIKEEQKSAFVRNQQYIEVIYSNISLRSDLVKAIEKNPNIEISEVSKKAIEEMNPQKNEETLNRERQRTADLTQTYNERYKAFQEALKIVTYSAILMLLSIFLLWLLIKKWVVNPINKFVSVSDLVSSGVLSSRLKEDETQVFFDEFDKLTFTFNDMLDSLESNIQEIKNKEEFLQMLIDKVPDGIRVIDEKGKTIITNQEYQRQIKSIKNIKNSILNQHLATNSAKIKMQNRSYTVESVRDLSEDINFMHQQKLSTLGFLGTSIAHEMKNHLGSIRIIIEGLLSKFYKNVPNNNEAKKYLTLVNKEIVECARIPEILLKLAQFSSKDAAPINCLQNINEVISLLDYEAKKNGISIKVETENDDITIIGMEADFKIIIMNLAQNAFNAMKNDGTLTIKLSQNKKDCTISVCDTGKGISKDELEKIFEPFYSGNKSNQKKRTGTGLGLAIVKLIVEKFGGTIKVKSKLGEGTCFNLNFPLHK